MFSKNGTFFFKQSEKLKNVLKSVMVLLKKKWKTESGSTFGMTKCRTTDVSEFKNFEYYNNERWVIRFFNFEFIFLIFHLFELFEHLKRMIILHIGNLWNFDSFLNFKNF